MNAVTRSREPVVVTPYQDLEGWLTAALSCLQRYSWLEQDVLPMPNRRIASFEAPGESP